jgi:hypothetical protein
MRSDSIMIGEAQVANQKLPESSLLIPSALISPIVAAKDAILESCIVSFAKPFKPGNKSSSVADSKFFEPFLREDMIPLLTNHYSIGFDEIIKKAITQRDKMVAHIDGDAFDFRQYDGASQMLTPIAGYERKDIEELGIAAQKFCTALLVIIRLYKHE